LSWWSVEDRYQMPLLLVVLVLAVIYISFQMVSSWVLNLSARRTPLPAAPSPDLRVDIFVTACKEPLAMVESTLTAAVAVRGNARVWLLDDGDDPQLLELTRRLGCGYLTRIDCRDAKAGNVNAALEKTNGDVIAIFDIDHAPLPDFLEKSLGFFNDPAVGFVQVMLTFRNFKDSWVARSAMESSLEFYNPTYLGANRQGAATLMGSNALIRREALLSIGGYRPGLAEDLATSIALHSHGWKSAYVAEPLAPGLSPSSLGAWSVQQLKWARGVFDLLIYTLPKKFKRLTWGQRLSYMSRMTKYWIGPAVFVHLAATILVLFFASAPVRGAFHSYLWHLAPLMVMDLTIRAFSMSRYRHPEMPKLTLWGAVVLIYASWPIYLLAWGLALLRVPIRFRLTPKDRQGRINIAWILPQITVMVLLVLGTLHTIVVLNHPVSLLLAFAIFQGTIQLAMLVRWVQADVINQERWRHKIAPGGRAVDVNRNPGP
jgi:cellulose synthase/poly-beta-1,6-N-acetylglucosamine synthase-like glycosyltransferase